MLKLAFLNLWRRKIRSLLIVLTAVISISFLLAIFILQSSVSASINNLRPLSSEEIDFVIREDKSFYSSHPDVRSVDNSSEEAYDESYAEKEKDIAALRNKIYINENLLKNLSELTQIAQAEGSIESLQGLEIFAGGQDQPLQRNDWSSRSQFNISYAQYDPFNDFVINSGRPPVAADELVLDETLASDNDLKIGDIVRVEYLDPEFENEDLSTSEKREHSRFSELEIVGLAQFRAQKAFEEFVQTNISVNVFHLDGLRYLLDYPQDKLEMIKIQLQSPTGEASDFQEFLPAHADAYPSKYYLGYLELPSYYQLWSQLEDTTIVMKSYVSWALLLGVFVIFNIFNAVLARRVREIALLRLLTFTRWKLCRLVFAETLLLGLFATIIGLVSGLGLGYLFVQLSGNWLAALSSEVAFIWEWQVFVWPAIFGVSTILIAGLLPIWQASRLKPLEVLSATDRPIKSLKIRTIIGLVLLILGLVIAANFIRDLQQDDTTLALTATPIGRLFWHFVLTILAIIFLMPAILKLCVGLSLRLFRFFINSNILLALGNINRQLGQASVNINILMFCVTLVVGLTIVINSLHHSNNLWVQEYWANDWSLIFNQTPVEDDIRRITPQLAKEMGLIEEIQGLQSIKDFNQLHIVDEAVRLQDSQQDEDIISLAGTEASMLRHFFLDLDKLAEFDDKYSTDFEQNRMLLEQGQMLVSPRLMEEQGWSIGQTVKLSFVESGQETEYVIGGEMSLFPLYPSLILDYDLYLKHFDAGAADGLFLFFNTAEDAKATTVQDDLERILQADPENYSSILGKQSVLKYSNQIYTETLVDIGRTFSLSLGIAFLGVTATLSLAVFERMREIGILRALGFNRRQIQISIVMESLLIVFLAIVIGSILGIIFAWGLYLWLAQLQSLDAAPFFVFKIPWDVLSIYLFVGLFLALLASLWPAIRAGKMDIVESITTDKF